MPDSYPLISNAIVGDTGLYTTFGRIFTGISGFYNLDPTTDQYGFAPYHENYQDMLVFLNKLYAEKLLDPNFTADASAVGGAHSDGQILGDVFLEGGS